VALRPLLSVDRYRLLFINEPQNLQVIFQLSVFEDKREGPMQLGKKKTTHKRPC